MSIRSEALEIIVKQIALVTGKDKATLTKETAFEELKLKSLEIVNITTALEDEFDVEVKYMDFVRNKTLGEAAEYIEELIEC